MIEIDLTCLDEITKPLLKTLLASTKDPLFGQGIYYISLYSDLLPAGENKIVIPVLLKNAFLVTPSKNHPGEYNLEIFSNQIGAGAFAKVYESEGKVKVHQDFRFVKRAADKERVIKAVHYDESERNKVAKEAQRANLGDSLKCKPALFSSNHWAFLVMKKAKGITLERLINQMRIREINPTLRELITVTRAILLQIDTVQQKRYAHRDIKPANVMVDLPNGCATLVDFAFAKELKKPKITCHHNRGTRLFAAPEVYEDGELTAQCDDFAAGLSLAELWGDTYLDFIANTGNEKLLYKRNREETFTNLYAQMNVPETIKAILDTIIYGLTRYDPEKRLSCRDCIALCDQLLKEPNLDTLIYTPPTPEEREQQFDEISSENPDDYSSQSPQSSGSWEASAYCV